MKHINNMCKSRTVSSTSETTVFPQSCSKVVLESSFLCGWVQKQHSKLSKPPIEQGQEDGGKATLDRLIFISSGVCFLGQAELASRRENLKKTLLYLVML